MGAGLVSQHCAPCDGGTARLDSETIEALRQEIPQWSVVAEATLARAYRFHDFAETLAFVNAIGAIAEAEGHHPDFRVHGWNHLDIEVTTHAIGGLSRNDFILAAKFDALPRASQGG